MLLPCPMGIAWDSTSREAWAYLASTAVKLLRNGHASVVILDQHGEPFVPYSADGLENLEYPSIHPSSV